MIYVYHSLFPRYVFKPLLCFKPMLAARTPTQYAEKVKQFILKKKVINSNYKVIREMDFLFFPLTKKITIPHAVVVNTKFSFPLRNKVPTIDELLKTKLT